MDVMLLLEAGSLTAVYTDFKAVADAEGRGLTLNEFVTAFLRHVHPDRYKRDALALVKQLIEIFDVIDVNGDASMEWSEFVSFCIEAGMAAVKREPKAAFGLQNDLQYTDAVTGGGGITGPQPGVSHGFAHARFEPDLNAVVVVEAHSRVLRFLTPRLRPICSLDASGAIRANKRSVDMSRVAGFAYVPCERLMAVLLTSHLVGTWAQTDKDGWRFLDVLPRPPGEGLVNTLAYDSFSHCLVLGTSTGAIHTFSPKERKLLRTVNVPSSAAASEGTSTGPGGSHHDVILSLCAVPSQGVLLSSCLDGTVAVWDTGRWKLRRVMTTGGRAPGGHVTKLLPCETNGMVFGLSAKNAIVGFDLTVGEATVALHFNHGTCVDFALLPSSPPRLVSMDSDATFRLWDVGDAALGQAPCTLTYHVPSLAAHAPRLCAWIVPQRYLRRVVAPGEALPIEGHARRDKDKGGSDTSSSSSGLGPSAASTQGTFSTLRFLGSSLMNGPSGEVQPGGKPAAGDDDRGGGSGVGSTPCGPFGDLVVCASRLHRLATSEVDTAAPPAVCLYNATTTTFVTAEGRDVLRWDADTGACQATYVDAAPSDISCACLDDRQRKLFLGQARGCISGVNLENGSLMKTGQAGAAASGAAGADGEGELPQGHSSTVSGLIYSLPDRCIISASWDGSLAVWDEEPQEELALLRFVARAHECDITALGHSQELALVVTGDRNGCVKAWDFQDLKLLAYLPDQHRAVVTGAACVRALPLFVTSDAAGVVVVWTSRGIVTPFNPLYRLRNYALVRELVDPSRAPPPPAGMTAGGALEGHRSSRSSRDSSGGGGDGVDAVDSAEEMLNAATVGSSSSLQSGQSSPSRRLRSTWLRQAPGASATGFVPADAQGLLDRRERLASFVSSLLQLRSARKELAGGEDGGAAKAAAAATSALAAARARAANASDGGGDSGTGERALPFDPLRLRLRCREVRVDVPVTSLRVVVPAWEAAETAPGGDGSSDGGSDGKDGSGSEDGGDSPSGGDGPREPRVTRSRASEGTTTASGAPGAPALSSDPGRVYIVLGDDNGRVRVVDISGVIARAGIVPVEGPKQPTSQPSYNPHRRMHRQYAGPVITDDAWFYSDASASDVRESFDPELLLDMQDWVAAQQARAEAGEGEEGASSHRGTGAPSSSSSSSTAAESTDGAPTRGRRGSISMGPSARRGSVTSLPGSYAGRSHSEGAGSGSGSTDVPGDGGGTDHRAASAHHARRSSVASESSSPPPGMTHALTGGVGVGVEAAARRRGREVARVMRRAYITAGVEASVSQTALDLLRCRVDVKAQGENRPLVAGAQLQLAAGANPSLQQLRSLQAESMARARRKRLLPTPELSHQPGDTIEALAWSAHGGPVTALAMHHAPHARQAGQGDDDEGDGEDDGGVSASRAALRGFFATSCGGDGRVLLWDASSGALTGQLGSTPADLDAILEGRATPTAWGFPQCRAQIEVRRQGEALGLLREIATEMPGVVPDGWQHPEDGPNAEPDRGDPQLEAPAPARAEPTATAAAPAPVRADSSYTGAGVFMTAVDLGYDDDSEERSEPVTAAAPLPPPGPSVLPTVRGIYLSPRLPIGGAVRLMPAPSPPTAEGSPQGAAHGGVLPSPGRHGHPARPAIPPCPLYAPADWGDSEPTSAVAAATAAAASERERDRVIRDLRLMETQPRPQAVGALTVLLSDIRRLAVAGLSQELVLAVATELAGATLGDGGEGLLESVRQSDAPGVTAYGGDMMSPAELAALDDTVAIITGRTGGAGGARSSGGGGGGGIGGADDDGDLYGGGGGSGKRLHGPGGGGSGGPSSHGPSGAFDSVLSSSAPSTAAAHTMGPAAVAVLAMSGFAPSGLAAAKAMDRVAAAVAGRVTAAGGGGAGAGGSSSTTPHRRSVARRSSAFGGEGASAGPDAAAPRSTGGAFSSLQRMLSLTGDPSDPFGADGALGSGGVPILDTRSALALVEATGGATSQQPLPGNLSKIVGSYPLLAAEASKQESALKRRNRATAAEDSDGEDGDDGANDLAATLGGGTKRAAPKEDTLLPLSTQLITLAGGATGGKARAAPQPSTKRGALPISASSRPHPVPATTTTPSATASRKRPSPVVGANSLSGSQPPARASGLGRSASIAAAPQLPSSHPLTQRRLLRSLTAGSAALGGVLPVAESSAGTSAATPSPSHAVTITTTPVNARRRLSALNSILTEAPAVAPRASRASRGPDDADTIIVAARSPSHGASSGAAAAAALADLDLVAPPPSKLRAALAAGRRRSSVVVTQATEASRGGIGGGSGSSSGGFFGGPITAKPGDPLPQRFGPYRSKEVLRVRQAFERADTDGSGDVDLAELMASPDWAAMYAPERIRDMFAAMDRDGSGSITAAELLKLVFPLMDGRTLAEMVILTTPRVPLKRGSVVSGGATGGASLVQPAGAAGRPVTKAMVAEMDAIFDSLDENGDGVVTMEELLHVLERHKEMAGGLGGGDGDGEWGLSAIADVLNQYDTDRNQVMERPEFIALMTDVWRTLPADSFLPEV